MKSRRRMSSPGSIRFGYHGGSPRERAKDAKRLPKAEQIVIRGAFRVKRNQGLKNTINGVRRFEKAWGEK